MQRKQSRYQDRHSALKTTVIGSTSGSGVQFTLVKLQWGKNDFAYSLHAAPNSYSSAGLQTTDFLSYLGFKREKCSFVSNQECYSCWALEDFELAKFGNAFTEAFDKFEKAERHLNACGFILDQPEGWGYFYGKPSESRRRGSTSYVSGDGHTSPKSELMKTSEDEVFQFTLSWITGGTDKGWTVHYRPKHLPLTPELQTIVKFLKLKSFEACPYFDFETCYWHFFSYQADEKSFFEGNAHLVHKWFDAHPQNFSLGIELLLSAQAAMESFGMYFLPIEMKKDIRMEEEITRNIKRRKNSTPNSIKKYNYDVAISFAGTERQYAETLASLVRDSGFDVFYDNFYSEQLWGKDLIVFFDEVYRKRSRYCVIFISSEYCSRMWTNHERRSAQARALEEKGKEYILPIRVDDSELPGLPPTVGYLSLGSYNIERIAEILLQKLRAE